MKQVENFKTAAKITVVLGVLLVLTAVLIFFGLYEYAYRKIYLPMAAVTLTVYLIMLWLKLHYFALLDEDDKIVIRFYNTHPFVSNYQQIKIRKDEFDGYEVIGKGLKQSIVLKIKQGKQYGKYPPVSISGLSREQRKILFEILDNIIEKKRINSKKS